MREMAKAAAAKARTEAKATIKEWDRACKDESTTAAECLKLEDRAADLEDLADEIERKAEELDDLFSRAGFTA